MKRLDLYGKVRFAVQIEGISKRAAAARYEIDPKAVEKMMEFSVPADEARSVCVDHRQDPGLRQDEAKEAAAKLAWERTIDVFNRKLE